MYQSVPARKVVLFVATVQYPVPCVAPPHSDDIDARPVYDLQPYSTGASSGGVSVRRHDPGAISPRHRSIRYRNYPGLRNTERAYPKASNTLSEIVRAQKRTNPDTNPPTDHLDRDQPQF